LLFIADIIFGSWVRMLVPYNVGFPIKDGGFFYRIIMGIKANNYRLLEYLYFNGLNIPFAYPPFAFYFAGLICKLFNLSIIDTSVDSCHNSDGKDSCNFSPCFANFAF